MFSRRDLLHGLKVASRTSAFQFRSAAAGIPAIAGELGVRHVLEGSVRKAGNRVRITAQLIDASTDEHLWSETFDRTLTAEDLFAIQDEIAVATVAADCAPTVRARWSFDSRGQRPPRFRERLTQPIGLVLPDLLQDCLSQLIEHAAHADMIIGAVAQQGLRVARQFVGTFWSMRVTL
jgi:hypothetical protein